MNLKYEELVEWMLENSITLVSEICQRREVETMYDKGLIPCGYDEYVFFENYRDIKPIRNSFSISYKGEIIEFDFYDDGTDLLQQIKNEFYKKDAK